MVYRNVGRRLTQWEDGARNGRGGCAVFGKRLKGEMLNIAVSRGGQPKRARRPL